MYRIYIEYIKYDIIAILLFVKKKNAKVIFQSFNHYSYYFSMYIDKLCKRKKTYMNIF